MPLPEPIGRQKEVLYLDDKGHTVVLGTAGSGKTTLAILRATYLAGHSPHAGRTMLVTFNRVLSKYLEALAPDAMDGVDIRNYHHFARGYLDSRGRLPDNSIVDDPDRVRLIHRALVDLRAALPKSRILQHEAATLAEELLWIARMGIDSEAEYRNAERIQRGGLRVAGPDRVAIWRLYEKYLELRTARGFTYDWHDLSTAVLEELSEDASDRRYRHIVIDEGQDFSPTMLRSLVAAVPPDGSITFFGDMAQQIYGGRISWRDAGLKVEKGIWRFEENYRNTKQIAAFALDLATGPHFSGVADMVEPKAPKAAGLPPTLVRCSAEDAERQLVVQQTAGLAGSRRVAVLLRDRDREDAYVQGLKAKGVIARRLNKHMTSWPSTPGAWVGTYHSSKGLEFDAVVLPHLDDGTLPDAARVTAIGDRKLGTAEEARLLYVAMTRARAQLVMTYHGNLTELLAPIDPKLYTHQKA